MKIRLHLLAIFCTVLAALAEARTALAAPEIDILGNGTEIVSGDSTPTAIKGTDFNFVAVDGGTATRTFSIANATGTTDLTLSGTPKVAISGPGAAAYTVTTQPVSPVMAGGKSTFTITFDPSAPGPQNATVTVASDDADEGTYTFSITGTGVPGAPNPRFVEPIEANNATAATALPLTLVNGLIKVTGAIFPTGDVDYYAFQATAGDRVYVATITSASAGGTTDSVITLLGSDGTTVIESDDNDGVYSATSSSIAGAVIPATGTYYLKLNDNAALNTERPYDLYLQVRSGTPVPETEPNDASANANPGFNNWLSGARNPAAGTEQDWFPIQLNAGDTVFLSLDLNPERDATVWNGRLGLAYFGDNGNNILTTDDNGNGDATAGQPVNPSEAFVYTVKNAGTYWAFVDSATGGTGGPTATYHLNISVLPPINETWTSYTSADAFPLAIGPNASSTPVSSTITIPGHPRIAKIRVNVSLTHASMAEVDVHLRSPAGNDIGLFTDIGAASQQQMDITLTDDAALVVNTFPQLKSGMLKPESVYRLDWFTGEDAGGTWTLDVRDDTNVNAGTLNSWSIEIVEEPAPAPGFLVFASDFESGASGFTHSGTTDQWALGTPATPGTTTNNAVAGLSTANSGVNCWKTNLTGAVAINSTHDLNSPAINLSGLPAGRIRLDWAMWYQIESANFEHAYVEIREVGGASRTRKVWQWDGATMTDAVGSPVVNIPETSGWATRHADISDFAGATVQVRFHFDTDSTILLSGWAIDDVAILVEGPAAAPEILLTGNTVEIVSGDSTPSATDGTDFGGTPVAGGTVARTFTIANTGNAPLNLTDTPKVAISGANAADFTVTALPTSPVAQNGSTTFEITFDPIAPGTRTATVTVANDDSNEGTYTFAISGSGLNPPIAVDEPGDVDDGDTTPGHVSIREAISQANNQAGGDVINLPPGLITLTSQLPALGSDVTIVGNPAGTTISGAGQFQVFSIVGGDVNIDGVTIADGRGAVGTGGNGGTSGGVQISGAANATITNCLFIHNLGGGGDPLNFDANQGRGAAGGLQTNSSGAVTIRNCTFWDNRGGAGGGQGRGGAGGVQFENGTVVFQSNTVAGNTGGNTNGSGGGGSGGAFTINVSPTITNNLFADNTPGTGATFNGGIDLTGTYVSGGFNLIQNTLGTNVSTLQSSDLQNANADLDSAGPRNHGGRTRTIRLGAKSLAIDRGFSNFEGGSLDQRGQARPVNLPDALYPDATGGNGADIGAYEMINAPIVVTSDTDTPAAGVLTLREAITLAESQPGEDNIVFDIPGAGVHTINLAAALPGIFQPLTIDGYTQPGAQANTLAVGNDAVILIELTGAGAGGFYGVNLFGDGSTVRGLSLGAFEWAFQVHSANPNVPSHNVISGNFIGVRPDGTTPSTSANNYGVVVYDSQSNTIGGTRPGDRNVISGSFTAGVYMTVGTSGSTVRGNYVGTNAAGTAALANAYGIFLLTAADVTVGGAAPGAGNVISGNVYHGIHSDTGSSRIAIQGNRIGTNAAGTSALGNEFGVVFFTTTDSMVGGVAPGAGNLISGNIRNGVYVSDDSATIAIRGNSIYGNGLVGIQLVSGADLGDGATLNDDGDADTGANNLQNFPVITSVTVNGGNTVITGTLNSTADTSFALDFYNNAANTPSGYGAGQTYLGTATVTTVGNNGTFNVTFLGKTLPEETFVTATATDPNGNTSEFSLAVPFFSGTIQTGPNFVVNTTADSDGLATTTETSLREAIKAANNYNGAATITFDATVFASAQTITLNKGALFITNNVTIAGPGVGLTVDGNGTTDHILRLPGGAQPTVTVSGLTLTGATDSGILNQEGTLTLNNCAVFLNNGSDGGGINNEGTLTLVNCSVSGNSAAGNGGGIANSGTLNILNSTISGNTALAYGGGLHTVGNVQLSGSTFSYNDCNASGGGAIHASAGLIIANNCTISGNHASDATGSNAGGIWAGNTAVTLKNCTITLNTAAGPDSVGGVRDGQFLNGSRTYRVSNTIIAGNTGATPDVLSADQTTFSSLGYNLIGDGTGAMGLTNGVLNDQVGITANPIDPRLGPLTNNGGPTQTHALLTTPAVSPAIDTGNSDLDTDQRGLARRVDNPLAANGSGNLSDIGAVEQGSNTPPTLQTGPNFVVNTTGDDNDQATTENTSLREAIKAANAFSGGGATITFDANVFAAAQTITLGGSELVISQGMTITGPGANKLTITGNNQSRVFSVNTSSGVSGLTTISGLTMTGGDGTGFIFQGLGGGLCNVGDLDLIDCMITGNAANRAGGGVHTHTSSKLTMRGCTVSNNTSLSSGGGGGLNSFHGATLLNCTISGNHADVGPDDNGGGIWSARGNLLLQNCTITGNTAAGTEAAGGLRGANFGLGETVTVSNSIIARNTGTDNATADVNSTNGATFISGGFNLIGSGAGATAFVNGTNGDQVGTTAAPLDPRLGPLANNGGPTPTHALLAFSPAIDKGKTAGGVTIDQRGLARKVDLPDANYANAGSGDASDIGAFEAQTEPPLPPLTGVDDAVTATRGTTRIYPLANDPSPSGRPLMLVSVSNPAITIDGRSLIIPAGFSGTFTYTFTDGTVIGSASITVTAGTAVTNARTFSGLLLAPNDAIAGAVDVTYTANGRAASVRLTAGARTTRFVIFFPAGSATGSRFIGTGTLTLTRNLDGTVAASFANAGDLLQGTLLPRKAGATAGRFHAALASVDSAIPGGGYLFLYASRSGAVLVVGRLPDGGSFSSGTSVRDDGTIAFDSFVRFGAYPPELVGGELVFANLTTTDLTGEIAWAKPVQRPGVRGLHLGGVNTLLTANGCEWKRQPLPAGTGTLDLSGGDLLVDEQSSVTITNGKPITPAGSLKTWVAYKNVGIFRARVAVPGLRVPVAGVGVYLPKSHRAFGFFPGTTEGGRIELTEP